MSPLPKNKKDALLLIKEVSEHLYHQKDYSNLKALSEMVEKRHQYIEQFFCDFKRSITQEDIDLLRSLQERDEALKVDLATNKITLTKQTVFYQQANKKMKIYTKISKQR